jgi:YrbI family 3-deoxy-D-manno-octulosonate 8-phosphate phosphatase
VDNFDFAQSEIKYLISDFDGVLTDNKVYVDSAGNELVCCSKLDSLGIDYYRKSRTQGNSSFGFLVLSTEKNPVVAARCRKLQLECHTGIENKSEFLKEKFKEFLNVNDVLEGFLYLGNDLNDLSAIKLCEFSAAPRDAHPKISEAVNYGARSNGGQGFVREILEKLIDFSN